MVFKYQSSKIITQKINVQTFLQQLSFISSLKLSLNKKLQNYLHNIFERMLKKVIMLVDNRALEELITEPNKNSFRGSAFKATEVDPLEICEVCSDAVDENIFLQQLKERIVTLEKRVNQLEKEYKSEKAKRRIRRRANEISKEFQCPHRDCLKFYGSETSLKNHLKIKHGKRC